jgi:hypothetical protein
MTLGKLETPTRRMLSEHRFNPAGRSEIRR